jgi:hypothetical protein
MSALKNQFQRARSILECLVQGTHPKTGDELPKNSVVNEIEVNRAMATGGHRCFRCSLRAADRSVAACAAGDGPDVSLAITSLTLTHRCTHGTL